VANTTLSARIKPRGGLHEVVVVAFDGSFAETLGETPLAWVTRARVRRAQELLETTPLSVERVATEAGFQTASNFRERFQTVVGTSPVAYRSSFSQLGKA
jgi:transcriptional regulator GlxA family with amidase domain